ncbi:MAG: hypothetical protein FWE16_04680 [Firmicutes bacterium]|nr:hypothetical protein [Bacillota bacterium]
MDLKSFSQVEPSKDEEILKDEVKPVDEKHVRDTISHYSKMSNDQLMGELIKQVGIQKDKGNASNMRDVIQKIIPVLNDEQRKRLEDIVKMLDI